MHIQGDLPPPYVGATNATTPQLALSLVADPATHDVLISIIPPKEPLDKSGVVAARAPVDICCVVDVSGSMGGELRAMMEEGKPAERTGLSTLDVVKHSVKTIIASMEPKDRISIVTFSGSAKVIVGLTSMTGPGKTQVLHDVEKLRPLDSTNLWDGLKTGMQVLNGLGAFDPSYAPTPRIQALFLLTDGQPNINPPRGIINMLRSYIDSNPLRFSIHTFGFGYSLESELLLEIARRGNGAFGFIPDATSLGAVFIHAVANLYSTYADRVELNINYPADGDKEPTGDLDISGHEAVIPYGCNTRINVGPVQYGQTRDFVVKIKDYPQQPVTNGFALSVIAQYRPWTRGQSATLETCTASLRHVAVTGGGSKDALVNLKSHVQRFAFLHAVDTLLGPSSGSNTSGSTMSPVTRSPTDTARANVTQKFQAIVSLLRSPPLANYPPACALAEDIAGEGLLALSSNEVYRRWGQHYLPSLARLHLLQQCGSFRDPGLQVYGAESPFFTKAREELDKIFDTLPPPKPSVRSRAGDGPSGNNVHNHSMSARFSRRSGPCFDGACEVALGGGQKMLVRDLRRGLHVETPRGLRKVVAVLKTLMESATLLCELPGGLRITPWHPIKTMSGHWEFPANAVAPQLYPCHAVYSLLLEPDADPDAHSVYVQDVLCVSLGHGITHPSEDAPKIDVRTHPFLGHYESIVRSLASFPSADVDEGVYCIGDTLKDVKTGTICGFVPHNTVPGSDLFSGGSLNNEVQVQA